MGQTTVKRPQFEEINKLALDILRDARNAVTIDMRFFDVAISKLSFVPFPGLGKKSPSEGDGKSLDINSLARGGGFIYPELVATDGEMFYYEPSYIIKRYRHDRQVVARDFLHSLLHCIFRHMNDPEKDRELWDLACDIAVESVLDELDALHISASRGAWQKPILDELRRDGLKSFSAERVYAYLRSSNLNAERLARYVSVFEADSHDVWYSDSVVIYVEADTNEGNENGDGDGNGSGSDNEGKGKSVGKGGDGRGDSKNADGGRPASRYGGAVTKSVPKNMLAGGQRLSKSWEQIAETVCSDLENFSKEHGSTSGNMIQNLRKVTREKYDYTAFLRRFSVHGEAMKLNDEEFDYIPYTYGMSSYKNMPFIEPLEYKDVKRVRDFVIAIDTSGSVYGDLVHSFLQKTYNILKSSESFFSKVNIHIIQCDAEIKEVIKIESLDDLEKYIKGYTVKGGGGTSFIPVFKYIDEKIKEKELTNLKGMIYFTDGYGDFPKKKPAYDAAFVFVEDDPRKIPDLPPWAARIVLSPREVERL